MFSGAFGISTTFWFMSIEHLPSPTFVRGELHRGSSSSSRRNFSSVVGASSPILPLTSTYAEKPILFVFSCGQSTITVSCSPPQHAVFTIYPLFVLVVVFVNVHCISSSSGSVSSPFVRNLKSASVVWCFTPGRWSISNTYFKRRILHLANCPEASTKSRVHCNA